MSLHPLSTGATVRPVAAKSLSRNGLTKRELHLVGAVTLNCHAILWINSQVELSRLLNEETNFQSYHPAKDGITASRIAATPVTGDETVTPDSIKTIEVG
jgi:hypothetical protein